MANFGKIILFRVEDLLPENNENAFYPSVDFPISAPFVKPSVQNHEWTSRKWYRILGKNYKLEGESLSDDVIYDVGPPLVGFGTPSLFAGFAKQPSQPEDPEKVLFVWTSDPELLYAGADVGYGAEAEYGDKVVFDTTNDPGFINHNLSLSKPLMSNQADTTLQQYGVGDSIKIKPIYNYYLKDYEEFYNSLPTAFVNNSLPVGLNFAEEKSIPNYYYLITLLSNPDVFSQQTSNSNAKVPFTMEGILEGILPSATGQLSTAPLGLNLPREIMAYEQAPLSERNSVVVVTPSFYKSLSSETKTQKLAHPFFNEIQIPITKGGTVFRDLFKKAKMYEQLQYRAALQIKIINKAVAEGMITAGAEITSDYNMFYTEAKETSEGLKVVYRSADNKTDFQIPYESLSGTPKLVEFDVGLNPNGVNYNFKASPELTFINFGNYVSHKRIVSPINNGKLDGSGVNFNLAKTNTFTNNVGNVTNPLTFYANNLESENEYIGSVIQNKANTILEFIFNKAKLHAASVFNNVENYSEVLFFEVQKLDQDDNLIQTFILPNDPDLGDFVEYIDSQIKYGKGYIYKIFAHTISIGNRLRRSFSNKAQGTGFDNFQPLVYDYENNLDIKLLRVPYHNTQEFGEIKTTLNLDNPPLPPQITFYPFKNVSNKIGFWFNVGLGSLKMKPIANFDLSGFEKTAVAIAMAAIGVNQLESGEITQEDLDSGKILYGTDDFGGKIEVYRTTELPKTYDDFKESRIADVDVVGPRTLIDDIVPNQDYYYTFRHIDVHGLPSNPTPVYHLKMITSDLALESDSVRVGVEALQPILFNELVYLNDTSYEEQEVEKSFKKYLLIEPTLSQTYLSFDNFENAGDLSEFKTANDVKTNTNRLMIGKGGENFINVKGKKFKIRVTSKQTGRKIDLNVDFKNLSVIENYKE